MRHQIYLWKCMFFSWPINIADLEITRFIETSRSVIPHPRTTFTLNRFPSLGAYRPIITWFSPASADDSAPTDQQLIARWKIMDQLFPNNQTQASDAVLVVVMAHALYSYSGAYQTLWQRIIVWYPLDYSRRCGNNFQNGERNTCRTVQCRISWKCDTVYLIMFNGFEIVL